MEHTVAHYIASLLTNIKTVTEDGLKHMQADIDALGQAFEQSLAREKVLLQLAMSFTFIA